jgi:aminopeptidase N
MQPYLDATAEQIEFFEQWFGPYPLDRYGLAISDSFSGLAMETLGRSLFSRDDFPNGHGGVTSITDLLLSHELAHQWYGNAVTLGRWEDIWLNESFATYGQWMWFEHIGDATVDEQAEMALATRPPGATGEPDAGELFGYNSYDGGAVVLHALRRTIGDDAFFTVLRQWIDQFDGESCTTGGFIGLAEEVSGEDLTEFFDEWLFATHPPQTFPA